MKDINNLNTRKNVHSIIILFKGGLFIIFIILSIVDWYYIGVNVECSRRVRGVVIMCLSESRSRSQLIFSGPNISLTSVELLGCRRGIWSYGKNNTCFSL